MAITRLRGKTFTDKSKRVYIHIYMYIYIYTRCCVQRKKERRKALVLGMDIAYSQGYRMTNSLSLSLFLRRDDVQRSARVRHTHRRPRSSLLGQCGWLDKDSLPLTNFALSLSLRLARSFESRGHVLRSKSTLFFFLAATSLIIAFRCSISWRLSLYRHLPLFQERFVRQHLSCIYYTCKFRAWLMGNASA